MIEVDVKGGNPKQKYIYVGSPGKYYYSVKDPERTKALHKIWAENNPDRIREGRRRHNQRRKLEALRRYSHPETPLCACCGEKAIEFLTIDHINGDGNVHRKLLGIKGGGKFYQWLFKNNYPDGFRVLCMNCNFSLGIFGYCPHRPEEIQKISKQEEYIA